jgi:ATP-dependent Lon protease
LLPDPLTPPNRLPVLPLRDVVVFPHMVIPLLIGRSASLAAVEAAAEAERWILLVAQKSAEVQEPVAGDLYRVGVIGRLLQAQRLPNGTTKILVEGVSRVRVTRYAPTDRYLRAAVAPFPLEIDVEAVDDPARIRRVMEQFEEYIGLQRRVPAEVTAMVQAFEEPEKQAFAIAAHALVRVSERQELLETATLSRLVRRLGGLLAGEIEILRLERKIEHEVRGSLFQNQREFYLQEQLKAIHRELGQEDADDLDELAATIAAAGLPDAARARAERELRRLRQMSPLSPEASVLRTYLDWLLSVPWSARTDDHLDVAHAARVLDDDHYGLAEVKDRILDYIATLSRVGTMAGPMLCLVGPPGVGKTSLGRSIARALGRTFARMSLGGVRDEAEIRGHRRTYIGAMPGRVVQAMRRAGVVNPVLLLDEVDKLGQDWRGDPSAALLEVLDPEQNRTFSDHYLEVDYDLSQVLFLTTANTLASIPEPLRDRMEIIRLPGYLDHEKTAIARQFLIPRQLRAHGIDPATVQIDTEAVVAVMRGYTREAGVRELERRIARIGRKLARRAAERESAGAPPDESTHIGADDLPGLLGVAPYDPDEALSEDTVGVALGLAYTQAGGELLEIEATGVRGRGKLQLTGTLGAVMKESAAAAMSYTRGRAHELGIDPEFYKALDVHVHVPAGATPKDGPSAGIAMVTAIVSALSGIPVRSDLAMTGEVTLRGRVLPIGGLKEKSVAALRNKITRLIIPKGNAREIAELPDEVRESVTFHPVSSVDEVLALALRRTAAVREAGDAALATQH